METTRKFDMEIIGLLDSEVDDFMSDFVALVEQYGAECLGILKPPEPLDDEVNHVQKDA